MNHSDWITATGHVVRPEARALVERGLITGAIRLDPTSNIKLKSGRLSPYFFNTGGFATGEDLRILAEAYTSAIRDPLMPLSNAVYGPPYKGIPLATMVAITMGGDYLACSSRKETKDHGDSGMGLLGSPKGRHTVLIDDVISSGGSAAKGVQYIEAEDGTPVGAVIAFDRQERAKKGQLSAVQDFWERFCLTIVAAATLDDLIVVLRDHGDKGDVLEAIYGYRSVYGVPHK